MEDNITIVHHGGGWISNIGNAFIDYGSMYSLKQAAPDADVHLTSSFGRWISTQMNRGLRGMVFGGLGHIDNTFNQLGAADADYIVQSGTCLSDHWMQLHGDALLDAKDRGAELLLYGVGMTDDTYNAEEIEKTREWLERLEPYAFVSRDERTYESFDDVADHSYNGIDNGFFSSHSHDPLKFDLGEYVVLNFDKRPEPDLSELGVHADETVVRAHHSFWFDFPFTQYREMHSEYYNRDNVLISDVPTEYLDVYAGSAATYSDRVHACVATLAYGHPAHLSYSTPRALLFERVGMGDITQGLIEPDTAKLMSEKQAQIDFMSEIL
jgi:hypothetical protein